MVIDCCVIILTCLFPPAGVFLVSGIGADLVINICLTILGFLPGHIHAFYLLVQYAGKPKAYQAVPTTTTVTKATTPNDQQQHRQYDVYQPKQQVTTQPVAQPIQRDKKDALVDNNYQQQQQQGSYNNQPSYSGQYKSTENPPAYKS